jgi:hypothetical protein
VARFLQGNAMTAKIAPVLLTATLAALACAPTRTTRGDETAVLSPGRVVVAPFNLALRAPAELSGIDEPVYYELLRYVQAEDRQVSVILSADAKLVWADAIAELEQSEADPDPRTASARFALLLAEHGDYDLLLMPSLVLRSARLHGSRASWDGVRRVLPVRGTPMDGALTESHPPGVGPEVRGLRGRVPAVSLHVAVLESDGRFVHEGLGGLDLIHEAALDRRTQSAVWRLVTRSKPFGDREHLRQGIALAFERRVPRTKRDGTIGSPW